MLTYHPPLRDQRFVFQELLDGCAQLAALPGFEEIDAELVDAMLEEAGRFCTGELLPLNAAGDRQGCRFRDGEVTTPEGYVAAYRGFIAAGWHAVSMDTEHGGQGLPESLRILVDEMCHATNISLALCPALSSGAYRAMRAHGSAERQAGYLPPLAQGHWSATMCLTESHCGTDLGLLRSRAEPCGDGSYRLSGTKIFISWGEHDLTENILHLVLARTPDAPAGRIQAMPS